MSEISGALYRNLTATELVKLGVGKVYGIVVNSHTSGTLKIQDGVDGTAGAKATSTLTTSGIVPAVHAVNVLTISDNFLDDVAAESVITSDATAPDNNDTVTIGSTVYTFKTALTPTAFEVLIGANAAEALDNLKSAINATAGAGTTYATGTTIHPTVSATDNTDTTQKIVAKVAGSAANTIATTETSGYLAWADTTLGGGTAASTPGTDAETVTIGAITYRFKATPAQAYDINIGTTAAESLDFLKLAINGTGVGDGTDYYTGTVAHTLVIATTNTDTTQTVHSRTYGTGNNTLATTETGATASWADTTLGGGTGASNAGVATSTGTFVINGTSYYFTTDLQETITGVAVPNEILWVTSDAVALDNMKLAINGNGTEGTDYSTGTNANPDVIATTNGNTTQIIEARVFGTLGNNITTTETMTTTAWTSTTLTGGTDAARLVLNTITLASGPQILTFPAPINFVNGLYVTVGGTLDGTVIFN